MNQVLVQAGLIASEDKIQAELVQSTLAQAGLSAEKQKAILIEANLMDATTGEIIATKACTKEELLNALAKKGITGANAEAIISTLGLAGANETATLSFSLFTKAVWANIKAIGIWLLTNPVGWFTLLAGATVGTALVLKQFNTTLDEAGKTLSEQNEKFKSLSDEVTTLGDELKTTKDRIKELEGLPSLTIVEDEELQKLKDTTAELEYQLAIKKEEQRIEAEKTAKAASDAYNASFQRMYDGNGELITSPTNENWNPVQELKNTMKAYEAYKKSYDELQTKITQDSEAGKNTSKDQKRLSNIKKQMTSIEEHAKEMADVVNDQKEAYEGLYAAGFDVQGNDLAIYEEVRDGTEAYQEFCNTLNDTTKAYSELSNEEKRQLILSKAVLGGKTKEEAQKIVDSISDEDLEFVGQIHFNRESTIQSVHDEIDAIKSEANSYGSGNKTDISFADQLAQIQSLSEGLDQLDKIYADVLDKEDFDWSSILNNDGFTKAFGDMQNVTDEYKSAYDDFINTITNNSNDISACQSAFDDLATAYIYNSGALDNLTIETKDATIAMLEQMGVENAKEFVESQVAITTSEIRAAQEALGISTENLTDLTIEQITQLLNEGEISDYARNHLYQLYLSQINLNNNPVDTTKTINNLLNIVGASSDAGKALAELGKIMVQISNAQEYLSTASGDTSLVEATLSGLEKRAEKIRSDATASFTSSVNVKSKYTGGSKTNSAKTNSAKNKSGSSSSAKDTAKTFDLIEIYINRISRSIDKLNKKVSNTWLSWSKRNKALKQELNKVLELQTAQEKAAKYYKKKANKITLSSDKNKDAKLKEQLRNGAINIKTVKDDKLAEKMQQYLDYWDKVKEYTDAAADSFEQYQSLVVQKFEEIQAKYDARIGYQENRKNAVQDALDLAEAKGQEIGSAYYTKQKGINDKEIKKYKNEEKELIKAMAYVPKYSEQWYEMKDAISEVHSKYVQLQADNAELQNSINELKFDRFDELINKIDDVGNECDFLKDLLSDDIFDDAGNITDDGVTAMGLTAMKGNIAASKRDYYKEQLAQLEKDYNNGNGTIGYDDYISRQREYKQGIQDSVKEINDARKATIDYVKQGLDAQNQALEREIDNRKKLLQQQKD